MSVRPSTIQNLKDWITFMIAVISCVVAIVLWVQNVHEGEFEHMHNEISSLKQDIEKIRENNSEILRIIGRLEGLIEHH